MTTEAVCGDCGEVDREPSSGSEPGSLCLCEIEARKWRGDDDEEDGEAEKIAQVVGRLFFSDSPVLQDLAVKLAGEFKGGRGDVEGYL